MKHEHAIYAAIAGTVVAIDARNGEELWRRAIRAGAGVTTISVHGSRIIAAAAGELWALDARSGEVIWNNPLKGLGFGFISLADAIAPAAEAAGIAASSAVD